MTYETYVFCGAPNSMHTGWFHKFDTHTHKTSAMCESKENNMSKITNKINRSDKYYNAL